jgi:hypothetical protein
MKQINKQSPHVVQSDHLSLCLLGELGVNLGSIIFRYIIANDLAGVRLGDIIRSCGFITGVVLTFVVVVVLVITTAIVISLCGYDNTTFLQLCISIQFIKLDGVEVIQSVFFRTSLIDSAISTRFVVVSKPRL